MGIGRLAESRRSTMVENGRTGARDKSKQWKTRTQGESHKSALHYRKKRGVVIGTKKTVWS